MFDAVIEFIQAIFEALTSSSSGSSDTIKSLLSGSSAATPDPETVPLTPLEPSTPIDPEVPGQEPLPDAATNPEDPRLN